MWISLGVTFQSPKLDFEVFKFEITHLVVVGVMDKRGDVAACGAHFVAVSKVWLHKMMVRRRRLSPIAFFSIQRVLVVLLALQPGVWGLGLAHFVGPSTK